MGWLRALPAGTVTILLTDIEASSRLWEADSIGAAHAVVRHREALAEVVEGHGGARPVEQRGGDGVVALFTRAIDAVVSAGEAQRALGAETWPGDREVCDRVLESLRSGHER